MSLETASLWDNTQKEIFFTVHFTYREHWEGSSSIMLVFIYLIIHHHPQNRTIWSILEPSIGAHGSVLVPQPGSSLNCAPFGVFMEDSLHRHDSLTHQPLVIDSPSSSLSPPQKSGSRTESSNLLFKVGWPWQLVIILRCFPKVTFININPVVVERGSYE